MKRIKRFFVRGAVTIITARLAEIFIKRYLNQKRCNITRNSKKNTRNTKKANIPKDYPKIHARAFVHPKASVIGQVTLGKSVYIAPFASIRGDEGLRIHVSNYSNMQDGAVLHGLKNFDRGRNAVETLVFVDGKQYSVYVGERVTMAHQCQVHGPCCIESNVFIGMQGFVQNSHVKEGVVIEPGAKVMDVTVPPGRYIAAGQVVDSQTAANALPEITPGYKYFNFNEIVVNMNTELAKSYCSK